MGGKKKESLFSVGEIKGGCQFTYITSRKTKIIRMKHLAFPNYCATLHYHLHLDLVPGVCVVYNSANYHCKVVADHPSTPEHYKS
jgi:hypothetical protein